MLNRFAKNLLKWFDQHGRKNLPWQHPRSPYCVWISEIMLQQTQVKTVIEYFTRFIERFPDVASLANASVDEVLVYWAGLGYYSRARNLHRCAQILHNEYDDQFPQTLEELQGLPGIGQSTAAAIMAQAFKKHAVILDGNVKRILARYHCVSGELNQKSTLEKLWKFAAQHTPKIRITDYTQAIMDLGALVCTRTKPKCHECPLAFSCEAFKTEQVLNFPTPKSVKDLPKRSYFFIIFLNKKNELLLQRQPDIGIWGGLWSLPTLEALDPEIIYEPLPFIEHRFTHFHLSLKPVICKNYGQKSFKVTENNQSEWVGIDACFLKALPTPIKKILQQFKNHYREKTS